MHLVAPAQGIFGTVPLVAATIPMAVGAALSAKLRGTDQVAVAFFGDGATDEGHFHESLNLAALYCLPVLFVCENNFYSTHLTLKERRVKDNIVECGFSWIGGCGRGWERRDGRLSGRASGCASRQIWRGSHAVGVPDLSMARACGTGGRPRGRGGPSARVG